MTEQEEASMKWRLGCLQGMAVIETVLGKSSGPKDTILGDAPSPGGILLEEERVERPSTMPIPSRPSSSNPDPRDKGKAPLAEDDNDEEDVMPKRRASAPSAPDINPETALEEDADFDPEPDPELGSSFDDPDPDPDYNDDDPDPDSEDDPDPHSDDDPNPEFVSDSDPDPDFDSDSGPDSSSDFDPNSYSICILCIFRCADYDF
ncbi:hypothetical protein L3X38_004209 [Prunus dulcis]|uniref:Uncharacterized protein n=1 Tax=Prunus dulcis TaxID=3755 RepID=A0AAD5F316_PRUDU|nr:hypothetical protein L3X38_004209 [Prunus dulcis]